MTKGWPDFLCYREDRGILRLMAVEVKASTDKLSEHQIEVHRLLKMLGVPVHVVREKEFSVKRGPKGKLAFTKGDVECLRKDLRDRQAELNHLQEKMKELAELIENTTEMFDTIDPPTTLLPTVGFAIEQGDHDTVRVACDRIEDQSMMLQMRRAMEAVSLKQEEGKG